MSSFVSTPRRVVITGLGVICPLGLTKESLWDALCQGRSGIGRLALALGPSVAATVGGQAGEFSGDIDGFGPLDGDRRKAIRKGLKVMCRECQMGVAAAQRAIADAGGLGSTQDAQRLGVEFGSDLMFSTLEELAPGIQGCVGMSGRFEFARWGHDGMARMTPLWLLKYLPNMPGSHIAIYNDMRGPNNSITQREASGNLALGEAYRIIARGDADLMVAGATGTRLHPVKLLHASIQEEVAPAGDGPPEQLARPFDLNRTGTVLGEGAAALVMEERESALRRGATVYGEVIGFGASTVLDRNFVARRDLALVNAMRAALADGGAGPEDVGHVHAHGLGTRSCDIDEAAAIAAVFGARTAGVPVVAAKSYFGNLGAGSGLVELAASLLALAAGRLFPVLNYATPDPECPLKVVRDGRTAAGDSFLNLSVTPQGQASCVLVRRHA